MGRAPSRSRGWRRLNQRPKGGDVGAVAEAQIAAASDQRSNMRSTAQPLRHAQPTRVPASKRGVLPGPAEFAIRPSVKIGGTAFGGQRRRRTSDNASGQSLRPTCPYPFRILAAFARTRRRAGAMAFFAMICSSAPRKAAALAFMAPSAKALRFSAPRAAKRALARAGSARIRTLCIMNTHPASANQA